MTVGRARGNSSAAASTGSFNVFGSRRGSPQRQSERDRIELLAPLREELAHADPNYSTVTQLVLDSRSAPGEPVYEAALAAMADYLCVADARVMLAIEQLEDDLLPGELLRRPGGDFMLRALERYIETAPEIGSDPVQAIIWAIYSAGKYRDETISEMRLRLASAYARRLRAQRADLLLDPAENPHRHTLRCITAKSILRPIGQRPDREHVQALTPLLAVVREDLETGLISANHQLLQIGSLLDRIPDEVHPEIPRLRTAIEVAYARVAEDG